MAPLSAPDAMVQASQAAGVVPCPGAAVPGIAHLDRAPVICCPRTQAELVRACLTTLVSAIPPFPLKTDDNPEASTEGLRRIKAAVVAVGASIR